MRRAMMPFAIALILDALGSGAALLVSDRTWQTVYTPQPSRVDVLDLTGRTVDSAPTALALVALAGVVAVLATKGVVRRAVGAVVAVAGAGIVWRAITASSAVGVSRARSLVTDRHRTVSVNGVVPRIVTHPVWPVLTVPAGLLVVAAGIMIAWRGHRWQVMSTKYEAAVADPLQDQARAATALWTAMDRGEDPTR
jgi:uncharacterized membrane protein (TIGR02234 family)